LVVLFSYNRGLDMVCGYDIMESFNERGTV